MRINPTEVLGIANSIAKFGEIVAGTKNEVFLLNYIRSFVEDYSDEVVLEPVPVTSWHEEYCYVESEGKTYRCAIQPPYSGSIDFEFKNNEVVFLSHDKVLDGEQLEQEVYDRVVVVETPRDPDDIATIAITLATKNPKMLVFSDARETIRRIVILNKLVALYERAEGLRTPVIVLPGSVAKKILVATSARVLGSSHTFRSHGYNLLAWRYRGRGSIYLIAHHDHWLSGASDNVLGVALVTALYKMVSESILKNMGISLALFTAEEGFPETINSFYWLVGSRYFVSKHYGKLFDELIAAVNIDVVYGEKARVSTANPILMSMLRGLGPIESDSIVFDSFSFTQAGLPSLTLHAFQDVLTNGVYHSELDALEAININTVEIFAEKAVQVLKKLAEYSDKVEIRELESTLSSEIAKQGGVNLDVAEALYAFFKELKKCHGHSITRLFNNFVRASAKTFVDIDIGSRLGVREFTVLLKCFDHVFSIPTYGLNNAVECYESHKFNIDLLKYIVCEVCKCEYSKAVR
uniref:M28 family peptidase n=1 Tax=Ignisphaera aggregans TaxID=334771 RepID=A0A7J3Z5V4_9CREN